MVLKERPKPREFDPQDIRSVSEFIKTHIIQLNTNETGCVDPRKSVTFVSFLTEIIKRPKHDADVVRRPGASFGYVMVVMAAAPELSARRAVDLVIGWENNRGRSFTIHEDDYAYGNNGELGCGHADRAAHRENQQMYGIPSKKVRQALGYLSAIGHGQYPHAGSVSAPMVKGPHKENGVLVVLSEDQTVDPTHPGIEFFRFDKYIDDQRLADLVVFFKEKGIPVSIEVLQRESNRQLQATLHLLARNLPIYEADLRDNNREVRLIGIVK